MGKFFGIGDTDDEKNIKTEKQIEMGQVAVDIVDTHTHIVILAPIAGIVLEDIDISINNGILTIEGARKLPEIFEQKHTLKHSECFWGDFMRNIILPENLDFDSIKASLENNLLIIEIPKLQFSTKNIKIDTIKEK